MADIGERQTGPPPVPSQIQFYLTSAASLISLYSITSVVQLQRRINRTEKKIKFVEDRPAYSPSELVMQLGSDVTARNLEFTPVYKGDTLTGYKSQVLIKGQVGAFREPPLITAPKGLFSRNIESVLKLKYKQEIYSNDASDPSRGKYIVNLKRILENCEISMHKQFLVKDDQAAVVVSNYDRINYEKALQMIAFTEEKRPMMPHEFVFMLGVLSAKFIAQLFFRNVDVSSFRGVSIGIRDGEVGIKVGSGIAVIGEVVYNLADKSLHINKPELILNERLSYLAELKKQVEALVHNRNVWGVIAVVSTLYLGRQIFKYLRKMNKLPAWISRHLPN